MDRYRGSGAGGIGSYVASLLTVATVVVAASSEASSALPYNMMHQHLLQVLTPGGPNGLLRMQPLPSSLESLLTNKQQQVSEYYTAFLNVSYVDSSDMVVQLIDSSEDGRFGSGQSLRNVEGLAVLLISSGQTQATKPERDPDVDDDDDDDDDDDGSLGGKGPGSTTRVHREGDDSGCFPPFRVNYPRGEPWVAVVRRGQCTFNTKIRNAMAVNASGIIIYDNEQSKVLQSMKVDDSLIPSVFTYRTKGEELTSLIRKYGKVRVGVHLASRCRAQTALLAPAVPAEGTPTPTPAPAPESGAKNGTSHGAGNGTDKDKDWRQELDKPTVTRILYCLSPEEWESFHSMKTHLMWNVTGTIRTVTALNVEKRTSVLFVSISFIVLMLISLAWLVFYYVQRFRYIHAKDKMERKLCSQAKKALAIISTYVLRKDDIDNTDLCETCAVCIETYRVADVVRILPCRHQFHKSCIDKWLLEKRTCPMCKMNILKHYGFVEEDPDQSSATVHGPRGGDPTVIGQAIAAAHVV